MQRKHTQEEFALMREAWAEERIRYPGLIGQTDMSDAYLHGDVAARARQFNGYRGRGWRAGHPDRWYANPGRRPGRCYLEFKRKGGRAAVHQHLLHRRLRGLGNAVYVVDSMGTWRAALMDFFGMEGLYKLRSPLPLPADDAVDDLGFPVDQVSPCRTPTHRTSHLSPLNSHLSPGSCLLNRRRAAGPHHL